MAVLKRCPVIAANEKPRVSRSFTSRQYNNIQRAVHQGRRILISQGDHHLNTKNFKKAFDKRHGKDNDEFCKANGGKVDQLIVKLYDKDNLAFALS